MSSSSRRFLLQNPAVVDTGCSCRSSKLSSFFSFSSSQRKKTPKTPFFSTTQSFDGSQSSSPSPANFPAIGATKKKKEMIEESVAVVKESWNPYLDFRESMMMMILAKEIKCWDGLSELLNQFLSLNSADNHCYILRAFADIWNEIFSSFGEGGSSGD